MKKFIFTMLILSAAFAANVDMRLDIEDKVYYIGDRISLEYTVSAGQDYFFVFPDLKQYLEKVEIVDISTDKKVKREKQIIDIKAEIVSFDTGFVHIPSMPLLSTDSTGFGKPDTFYTPEKYIYVYSILDSAATPLALNAPLPLALMTWWEVLVTLLLLGLAVSILFIGLKKCRNRKLIEDEIWESPQEKAEHLLKALEEKKYPKNEKWKAFYLDLTYIARDYFENIYYIHLQELITSDLVLALSECVDHETKKQLEELFQYADVVKFAKGKASVENCNQHLNLVKKIITEGKNDGEESVD